MVRPEAPATWRARLGRLLAEELLRRQPFGRGTTPRRRGRLERVDDGARHGGVRRAEGEGRVRMPRRRLSTTKLARPGNRRRRRAEHQQTSPERRGVFCTFHNQAPPMAEISRLRTARRRKVVCRLANAHANFASRPAPADGLLPSSSAAQRPACSMGHVAQQHAAGHPHPPRPATEGKAALDSQHRPQASPRRPSSSASCAKGKRPATTSGAEKFSKVWAWRDERAASSSSSYRRSAPRRTGATQFTDGPAYSRAVLPCS